MSMLSIIINYQTTPHHSTVMTEIPKQQKTYQKYNRRLRLELIRLVDEENLSTTSAAKRLGIKQTSACKIMRTFHQEHRIFESKASRAHRLQKDEQAPRPRITRSRREPQPVQEVHESSSPNQPLNIPYARENPHAAVENQSYRREQQAQEIPQVPTQQLGPQLEQWGQYPFQMCYFLPFQNGFQWPGM